MPVATPRIPCRSCAGCGTEPLPQKHHDALKLLRNLGELTVSEIHHLLNEPVGVTAIHNRLTDLLGWGYVERRASGSTWIYRAK